ncbi:hypothetical protein D3C76_1091840 [compost metagenome]
MTDTFGTQLADGLPDALRTRRFTGMDGNVPACIPGAIKVGEEQTAREAQLVARQIHGGDMVPVRQQSFELLQAGVLPEGTAHDANQARFNVKGLAAFAYAGNDGFHHTRDR